MSSWGQNATNQHCKRHINEIKGMSFPACQSWTDWGITLQSLKKEFGKLKQIHAKFRYIIVDTKAHDLPRKICISHNNYFLFWATSFWPFYPLNRVFIFCHFLATSWRKKQEIGKPNGDPLRSGAILIGSF